MGLGERNGSFLGARLGRGNSDVTRLGWLVGTSGKNGLTLGRWLVVCDKDGSLLEF